MRRMTEPPPKLHQRWSHREADKCTVRSDQLPPAAIRPHRHSDSGFVDWSNWRAFIEATIERGRKARELAQATPHNENAVAD